MNQVHLVLYNQFHLDQVYQLLASDERFTELLTSDLLPSDQGQEPAVAAPDNDPVITEAIKVVPLVEDNILPEYPEQREYSTTASLALGLDNQEEYTRLGRYLHERRQLDAVQVCMDGACMFASFRRVVDAPLQYTSSHLSCQLIITICNYKEFFYPLLMESRVPMVSQEWIQINIRGCMMRVCLLMPKWMTTTLPIPSPSLVI